MGKAWTWITPSPGKSSAPTLPGPSDLVETEPPESGTVSPCHGSFFPYPCPPPSLAPLAHRAVPESVGKGQDFS